MSRKQELLDHEEKSWRELCARFDRVRDWEQPGVGEAAWTPKDLMAHVTVWHAKTTERLERLRSSGELPEAPDVDAFNAEHLERCRELTLHDVRVMSGASRHRFREEVGRLPEPIDDRVAALVAADGHEHYAEHLPDLDAFVGRA